MVQRRRSLSLAPETFQRHAILRQFFRKKLQRDEASEARVFRLINHAHAAAAKLFDDPVMREGLIEQEMLRRQSAMLKPIVREVKTDSCSAGFPPASWRRLSVTKEF